MLKGLRGGLQQLLDLCGQGFVLRSQLSRLIAQRVQLLTHPVVFLLAESKLLFVRGGHFLNKLHNVGAIEAVQRGAERFGCHSESLTIR